MLGLFEGWDRGQRIRRRVACRLERRRPIRAAEALGARCDLLLLDAKGSFADALSQPSRGWLRRAGFDNVDWIDSTFLPGPEALGIDTGADEVPA